MARALEVLHSATRCCRASAFSQRAARSRALHSCALQEGAAMSMCAKQTRKKLGRETHTVTPPPTRAPFASTTWDVRAERAPRNRGVHEGLWGTLGVHIAHFRPMCASPLGTACATLRALLCPARAPRDSTCGPGGAGGPSGSTRTCSMRVGAWLAVYTPFKNEFRRSQKIAGGGLGSLSI